jgi:hypothetical protein
VRAELADTLVSQLAVVTEATTAFEAEVAVSVVLGTVFEAAAEAAVTPESAAELLDGVIGNVVDKLAYQDPPHAYLALRALAVVAPPQVTDYAAAAAEKVPADDALAWIADLGQVTVGSCLIAEDPFGEGKTVLCEFTYPGGVQPHGVFAVTDGTWHGALTTLVISDESPDKRRRNMEKDARRRDSELREASPEEAAAILRDGIRTFRINGQVPGADVDGRYGLLCSSLFLASARVAALAPGVTTDAVPVAERWPAQARQRLVEEFLASPYASELRDPVSRKVPSMLAFFCVSHLGCDPTAIGPAMLDRLLLDVLPAYAAAPDRFGLLIPQAVRAWTEWLAERNGLSEKSRKQLTSSLRKTLLRFGRAWHGPNATPLRRYLEDLSDSDASDGAIVSEVLERRRFAVPVPYDRVSGIVEASGGSRRDADELDAADENDRTLITVFELSARGLAQQRFPSYLAVVRQLWDDQPAGVWAAARRMSDAGRSREAVLDRLARAWDVHGDDDEGYAVALRRLSLPKNRQSLGFLSLGQQEVKTFRRRPGALRQTCRHATVMKMRYRFIYHAPTSPPGEQRGDRLQDRRWRGSRRPGDRHRTRRLHLDVRHESGRASHRPAGGCRVACCAPAAETDASASASHRHAHLHLGRVEGHRRDIPRPRFVCAS